MTLIRFLSSAGLLRLLAGAWMVYYVTLAVWTEQAFAGYVSRLRGNLLFQALFVLFLLVAFLNLIRAASARYRASGGRWRAARAASTCVWIMLPAGTIIFLLGFLVGAVFRQYDWLVVSEGDSIRPQWQERAVRVAEVDAALKDEALDTESIPGIFSYEPRVVLESGDERREVGVFPPVRFEGSYYHILKFGIAPGVRLQRDDGGMLSEGYMALSLLPPGVQDTFTMDPFPYRFGVKVIPERIIQRGEVRAKLFNLRSPSYELEVQRGEKVVFRGPVEGEVSFEGLRVSFFGLSHWVLLEASSDAGLPLLVLGLGLMALGLPFGLLIWLYGLLGRAFRHAA